MNVKTKTETILTFESSEKIPGILHHTLLYLGLEMFLVNYYHQSSIFRNFKLLFPVFSTHFGSERETTKIKNQGINKKLTP